jgi:sodium transport system ATP-binding protein
VRAVQDVSFVARDGRVTGLLGPNGAGKSTTLRMLYTVLEPDGGHATIDSCDITHDRLAARRRIGVLPHGAGLYPNLTARENIRYHGELAGLPSGALAKRIDELIGLLDLGEVADRRARGFSQGQRTRVALARALVHDPQNLLLDEPSNGLDVLGTRALRALIGRLRDAGRCLLFSSHVMQEVAALCDDIVIIAHGRVVAAGTPEALRTRANAASLEDAFVAAIGTGEGLQ